MLIFDPALALDHEKAKSANSDENVFGVKSKTPLGAYGSGEVKTSIVYEVEPLRQCELGISSLYAAPHGRQT